MSLPLEIIRQFLTSRSVTLAFRCTCKEYQNLTGSGWTPYIDSLTLGIIADGRVLLRDYYPYASRAYEILSREFIVAGLGKEFVYCGILIYKTNIPAGPPPNPSNHLYKVDGQTVDEIVDKIIIIRNELIPARDGKFKVTILKYMPAETWKWFDD